MAADRAFFVNDATIPLLIFSILFSTFDAMRMNEIQLSQLLDQARAFINEGKHLHAEQMYHRLIREEPAFLQPYKELASLYAENGNITAGINILVKARRQFPTSGEVTFLLGSLYQQAEEYDKALTCYRLLAAQRLQYVHFNMGVVYFYKGNIPRAEEQIRLTLKLDPNFPKVNETLGELLLYRNAYAEAIRYLKRGIALDPYSWISHHLLGMAYHAIGDTRNAYNEFVLAIEMDPNEAHSWQRCGEVLLEMKRYDEAEQYLRKALELNPNFADALANFGQLYLLKGDPTLSEEYFTKALNLDPRHSRARYGKLRTKVSAQPRNDLNRSGRQKS